MSHLNEHSSSISREQVLQAYLKALQMIDQRVAPLLGKVTTRVLVMGSAKRVVHTYPFLCFLVSRPYTELIPSIIQEQMSGITTTELADGLHALLDECFAGLRELTGDIIVPPLHAEVHDHLRQIQ